MISRPDFLGGGDARRRRSTPPAAATDTRWPHAVARRADDGPHDGFVYDTACRDYALLQTSAFCHISIARARR